MDARADVKKRCFATWVDPKGPIPGIPPLRGGPRDPREGDMDTVIRGLDPHSPNNRSLYSIPLSLVYRTKDIRTRIMRSDA